MWLCTLPSLSRPTKCTGVLRSAVTARSNWPSAAVVAAALIVTVGLGLAAGVAAGAGWVCPTSACRALADELGQAYIHLDVADRAQWDAAIAATEAQFGKLVEARTKYVRELERQLLGSRGGGSENMAREPAAMACDGTDRRLRRHRVA